MLLMSVVVDKLSLLTIEIYINYIDMSIIRFS
jgi:hypothetical protein